jgi:hypothetical protein
MSKKQKEPVGEWHGCKMKRTRDSQGRFEQESYIKAVPCERCGKLFRQTKKRRHFCSQKCYRSNTRYIDPMGYVCIKMPEHPHATTNGWVREHIVVACQKIGRPLQPGECVHHLDGNRQNNIPDNLVVIPLAVHARAHKDNPANRKYGEKNPKIKCACGCGKKFAKYDKRGRPRKYLQGHH